ncbi:MAG: helix-turn-helix domain-containing protein, partial [Candidatus Izemoplasmatales bacterium]
DKLLGEMSNAEAPSPVFPRQPEPPATTGVIPVKQSERTALVDALHQADGNQTRAAEVLGVSRVTVWKRMKKHGIIVNIRVDNFAILYIG